MPMQDALSAFDDSITDDQIKEMMNEVDVDNSGSIDYGEFLMLSVPGFCKSNKKKRPLQLPEARAAVYEDTLGGWETSDLTPIEVTHSPPRQRANKPKEPSHRAPALLTAPLLRHVCARPLADPGAVLCALRNRQRCGAAAVAAPEHQRLLSAEPPLDRRREQRRRQPPRPGGAPARAAPTRSRGGPFIPPPPH